MATVIKASCSYGCGDIKTDSTQVTLRVMKGNENGEGEYRFKCPQCNAICLKTATTPIANLLRTANVDIEVWELPLELMERPPAGTAEPISHDDIIDLGLQLDQDEEAWMKKMTGEQ